MNETPLAVSEIGPEVLSLLDPELLKLLGINPSLPWVVVDDDFFEYLEEESIEEILDIDEFLVYYLDWEKENVVED